MSAGCVAPKVLYVPAVLRPATAEQMIISHMTKKRGESTSLIRVRARVRVRIREP